MKTLLNVKRELALAAHRAYTRGIQSGNGGNVSARVPGEDLMIIKPSGGSFIDCDENSWIITDFDGNIVEGNAKPSGEALLHGTIYKYNPSAQAIIHGHAPYTNTIAYFHDRLPAYNYHSLFKLGGFTRVLDVPKPGVTKDKVHLIKELYEETPDVKAFILPRHGLVAVGKDPLDAEHNAELVEETAQVAFMTELYGKSKGVTIPELTDEWWQSYLESKKK